MAYVHQYQLGVRYAFGRCPGKCELQVHDAAILRHQGTRKNIDPTSAGGARLLDAGVVEFTNDSFVEAEKALGLKDGTIYCVAPITRGDVPLAT